MRCETAARELECRGGEAREGVGEGRGGGVRGWVLCVHRFWRKKKGKGRRAAMSAVRLSA